MPTKEYYQAHRDKVLTQQKKYKEMNREKILEQQKKYHEENGEVGRMMQRCRQCSNRKWWADARENLGFGECIACGAVEYIHAHHVDADAKAFSPSDMSTWCPSRERLAEYVAELKKCIPLCQKCHNKIHSKNPGGVHEALITNNFEAIAGSLSILQGRQPMVPPTFPASGAVRRRH